MIWQTCIKPLRLCFDLLYRFPAEFPGFHVRIFFCVCNSIPCVIQVEIAQKIRTFGFGSASARKLDVLIIKKSVAFF